MTLVKYLLVASLLVIGLVSGNPFANRDDANNVIVGGFETTIEENPWQVSFRSYDYHNCGGSIIGKKWVLTAGHCAASGNGGAYSVRVGSSFHRKDGTVIHVKRVIRHENYNAIITDFDFSLLELDGGVTFSDKVQSIALPDEDIVIDDGEIALVSGWGATHNSSESNEQLRAAYVPIANQEYCSEAYKKLERPITGRMVCAGYEEGGKDSCQGDSGGPLSIERDGVRLVVGVVSWGKGCAEPSYPGVYSRISSVRSWIKSETGI